jgi:hypothetical protein
MSWETLIGIVTAILALGYVLIILSTLSLMAKVDAVNAHLDALDVAITHLTKPKP